MRYLQTRSLSLRFLTPSRFLSLLMDPTGEGSLQPTRTLLPKGIEAISSDDTTRRLTVRGEEKSIEEMVALLQLLDVKPKLVQLTLTRGEARGTIQTPNNQAAVLCIVAEGQSFSFTITPHINGDGTISLFLNPNAHVPSPARRVRSGETLALDLIHKFSLVATLLP